MAPTMVARDGLSAIFPIIVIFPVPQFLSQLLLIRTKLHKIQLMLY